MSASCHIRGLSPLHLLFQEHTAQPRPSTVLTKNSFLLRLLSAGIVTVGPNPQNYFPTSFLILSLLCCSEWCFTERFLGLFSQPSSWVCRLKKKDDPANNSQMPVTLQDSSSFHLSATAAAKAPQLLGWNLPSPSWHCIAFIPLEHNRVQGALKNPKSQSLNFLSQPPRGKPLMSWHIHKCTVK